MVATDKEALISDLKNIKTGLEECSKKLKQCPAIAKDSSFIVESNSLLDEMLRIRALLGKQYDKVAKTVFGEKKNIA